MVSAPTDPYLNPCRFMALLGGSYTNPTIPRISRSREGDEMMGMILKLDESMKRTQIGLSAVYVFIIAVILVIGVFLLSYAPSYLIVCIVLFSLIGPANLLLSSIRCLMFLNKNIVLEEDDDVMFCRYRALGNGYVFETVDRRDD